ncbi:hypothetical protein WS70_05205 [Burkholderia mayonis]|uniref:Uncharacterized protein n=2 Tax=Burkholderiaceae TaxID=119060 RepID=A0A1B4FCB2_9BURK|nr:hypothetical protein WS70_05205 [Burkholderia mayonis]KVE44717.1 hypothetical protein WS69_19330 [Burkholderia sp. BDU5]KVE46793.1 hypothetical protein WS70_02145 [Burkholderia mayonis]
MRVRFAWRHDERTSNARHAAPSIAADETASAMRPSDDAASEPASHIARIAMDISFRLARAMHALQGRKLYCDD